MRLFAPESQRKHRGSFCSQSLNVYKLIKNIYIYIKSKQKQQSSMIEREIEVDEEYEELRVSRLLRLQSFEHAAIFNHLQYPWQVLSLISSYASTYISNQPLENRNKAKIIGSVHIDEDVLIGQGTVVEHGAMIKGPAIIGRNCQIRKGAYIRGNAIIGDNCIIGNSTEIKNSILFNNCQVCHFNYIGDSVLGEFAHFAAGAITSNLKLAKTPISISYKDKIAIKTGYTKFGAIVGDKCEVGCNAVLNPGTILGKECVVYPNSNIRGVIKEKHIVKVVQEQVIVQKS